VRGRVPLRQAIPVRLSARISRSAGRRLATRLVARGNLFLSLVWHRLVLLLPLVDAGAPLAIGRSVALRGTGRGIWREAAGEPLFHGKHGPSDARYGCAGWQK